MRKSPNPASDTAQQPCRWESRFEIPVGFVPLTFNNPHGPDRPIAVTSMLIIQRIAELVGTEAEIKTTGVRFGWSISRGAETNELVLPERRLVTSMPNRNLRAESRRANELMQELDRRAAELGIKRNERGALFIVAEPQVQPDLFLNPQRSDVKLEVPALFTAGRARTAVIFSLYSRLVKTILSPNEAPNFGIKI